ncbi:MAG: DUF998 domain-containing protein [Rhodanobacter sp.]
MNNPSQAVPRPSAATFKTRGLGIIALLGVLAFGLVAIAVECLRTDLHWRDSPLSFYLLGPWGNWLQAAYVVLALALVALGAGYYLDRRGQRRSAAPWLLFCCAGIGLCVTALAHSNLPGSPPKLEGFVHGVAAQAAFLCVTVAMLLQSCWLRAEPCWRFRGHLLLGLAGLCFVAIWVDALWRGMPRGLEQRLVIALILTWLLLAAAGLIWRPRVTSR